MLLKSLIAAAATSFITCALGAGVAANAAGDTTPPVWAKVPTNSIMLGATLTLDPMYVGNTDPDCMSFSMPINVSWSANDPESGISRYGWSPYDLGPEDATTLPKNAMTATAYVDDEPCGGGGEDRNIYAFNGAGLSTGFYWQDSILSVTQDDALNLSYSTPWWAYNGSWATSACNCWSGGTTQRTTQSGASATLTIPYDPIGNGSSYGVGLVMAKGPDRGKAAIFVDNVKVATVDTHSTSKVNQTVVWRQSLSVQNHTVKVVDLGTAGHSRIDIDAAVLVPKTSGMVEP
jgi:hypothetical protein